MNKRSIVYGAVFAWLIVCLSGCSADRASQVDVRIVTFNTALSRDKQGELHAAFARGDDEKAKLVAEVLQRTRPDIVLLQEIDYDPTGQAYADFQDNYLKVSHNGAEPIHYDYVYAPPVNTGVLAPVDLDGDGKITRPNDCFGFGRFDGQYGMVVMSRYPIDISAIQTFQNVRWIDLPGNHMPTDYYAQVAQNNLRLSSKTHARVPIRIGERNVELLISHPTPPVFDGKEDRNGRRNFDEIAFWPIFIEPGAVGRAATFPEMDAGGWDRVLYGTRFVVMGDLNADPNDGESRPGAANQLIDHNRIRKDFVPTSAGALEAASLQGGKNLSHKSDPAADTADFGDTGNAPGNLRVDYVLPSVELNITGSGVYWPTRDDPYTYLNKASDHKLVWIDVVID